jgi:hypothetical protein
VGPRDRRARRQLARVRRTIAATLLWRSPNILEEMLRYVVFSLHLMSLSLICQRHHSIDQRLARWLSGMIFPVANTASMSPTINSVASLGVRREGISETMKEFEVAGLLVTRRGHLEVIDAARLRSRACGCIDEGRETFMRFFPRHAPTYSPVARRTSAHGIRVAELKVSQSDN